MKEMLKKTIAIFVLMMMFINSSFLVVLSTAIDAIDRIIDEAKIHPLYEINLEKYVNYSLENANGTLVQLNLKTGIEYVDGEEYKPLSSTGILLNVPKIEDEYPEDVEVIGKSTKATNGSDIAKDFEAKYDKETGELKIVVASKEDEEGNIYNQNIEGARDEYTIICHYSSNCYNNENVERELHIVGAMQTSIADYDKTEKRIDIDQTYVVAENISGLISTNVITSEIYNGYMNSNKKNGTEYKTEYIENLEIDISKKELSEKMIVNTKHNFIDKEDNSIETEEIIYKSTKVNKNDILDILGEDGYLRILNANGELLGEVNKDTEVEENNIYEITYNDEVSKIIIETSKAKKVGTIFLQNIKEIKETVTNDEINRIQIDADIDCINNVEITKETEILDDEEVKEDNTTDTNNIETENIIDTENIIYTENEINTENEENVKDEETKENIEQETIIEERKVYNFSNSNTIQIKESNTNIDLTMNRTEWTNNIQNEVEFTVKLIANNIRHKLFENPVIEIRLPNEVEKVILKESSLLYANDDLEIEDVEIIEDNNSKIIRAELSGIQSNYYNNNSMIEGTELLIPATIIVKKDIYDVEGKIELNVTNNNTYEEKASKQYNVNIISINLQTSNEVEIGEEVGSGVDVGTSEENGTSSTENTAEGIVTEINATLGEKALVDGQTVYEHEYIRYNIKVKNESNYRKENINIIGKVPEGTTYVRCYFGEYSFETEDFYHIEEDDTVTEYNQNISLDANEEINLEYWIRANLLGEEIQKNIESDISILVGEETVNEYKINNIVKKAKLELKVTASESDGSGNIWIYHFAVKNTTGEAITNVVANINWPDEVKFVSAEHQLNHEYGYSATETTTGLRIDIPNLGAKEEKVAWIKTQVSRIDESKIDFEIETYGTVKGDNTDTYNSNLNKEEIHTFGVQLTQSSEKEGQELEYDEEIEFKAKIKNISNEKLHITTQSVKIMNYADPNLIPISVEYEYEKNVIGENRNEIVKDSFDISTKYVPEGVDPSTVPDVNIPVGIVKNGEINITIKYKAGAVKERTETSNCIKVQYDYGGTHVITSNIIKNVILPKKEEPEVPDIPEEPKTYSISGFAWNDENKNGQYDDNESKFSNVTIKLIDANTYTTVVDSNGNAVIAITNNNGNYIFNDLKIGRYILAFEYDTENYSLASYKVATVSEDRNSDVIRQQLTIDGVSKQVDIAGAIDLSESNVENINIGLVKKDGNTDIPEIPEEPKAYSISGFAWEDKNKNGQYDEEETKLSNITVKLVNSETNENVVDDNGNKITTVTDSNGNYTFENVKIGQYLLIFEYDTENYSLTSYKKIGVSEDKNSNAIKRQLTIDGVQSNFATTDIITLRNRNIEYINIGLVKKEEQGPEEEKKYIINGFAWEDKNKNGQYDEEETKLSNITVKLFDSEENTIVKDSNGRNLEIKTNNNGEYEFNNISKGKYIVLFEYDTVNYSLTSYKKELVSEDKNSDVISKKVTIDGIEKDVALTDILNVETDNLEYINIGLIKNEKPQDPQEPQKPQKPEEEKTYSISGFVWEDKNKDGKYDDNESKLSNITVKLFNSKTNSIVKDKDGKNLEVKTNDNGEYKFEKVNIGEYLVLFEYDSNNYNLTTYKKEMVSEDKNSDVITKKVAIDGVEKTVAITDALELKDRNIGYINAGLVKKEKFDLSLDKSITKLKVSYEGFNKEYNYDESKLVKIEIPAKKISGAKIEVEYQIKVTNEGETDGYIDEIVDYLPEGFNFEVEQNSGWTQNGNGMLKNTTYSGVIIKPGETKAITLYLTRTLANESIGTLRNSAEILKSSSINGEKDIDSINGNKVETEDDYSVAELIISIKTGAITYIGISIILGLAIIIILKILADKKIINFRKLGIFIIGLVVMGIVLMPKENSTYTTDRNPSPSSEEIDTLVRNYIATHSTGSAYCYYSTEYVREGNSPTMSYDWINGEHEEEEEYEWEGYKEVTVKKSRIRHYDKDGKVSWKSTESCGENAVKNGCYGEDTEWYEEKENRWVTETRTRTVKYSHYHKAHGYKHHGAGHGNRELYCIDGGDMATSSPGWEFHYTGVRSVNISAVRTGSVDGAVTLDNNSRPSYLPYDNGQEDNNNFVVGPFNFSTNGTITGVYPTAGQICDRAGNPTTVSSGADFYVLVTKDILDVGVTVNVQKAASMKYYVNATWTAEWTSGSGGQTLGYDDGADNIEGEFSIQTYDSASAYASLPVTNIIINKEDYDTLDRLNGCTVIVQEPYYHYRKPHTINGTLSIGNVPAGQTYTITEIITPQGRVTPTSYKLPKQQEYNLAVNTTSGGVVTIINREFVDIGIDKKVYGYDKRMEQVGFKVYAVTKDGSGYLRSANCRPSGVPGQIDVGAFLSPTKEGGMIFYTDGNGRIILTDLPKGTYRFEEVSLPIQYEPWYNMEDDPIYVQGGETSVIIEDTMKRGHITLTKRDYDTWNTLGGAKFNLTNNLDPNDIRYVNMDITIPERGQVTIRNLPIGRYTLTETKVPDDPGYDLDYQIPEITIEVEEDPAAVGAADQQIIVEESTRGKNYDITNRQYMDLVVQKKVFGYDKVMEEVSFKIYAETTDGNGYLISDTGKVNNGILDIGSLIGADGMIFTTGPDGKFELHDLPMGTYTIEEISLPPQYEPWYNILDNKKEEVIFSSDEAAVTVTKKNGEVIVEDTMKRGHLILTKMDYDTKEYLAGAEFNITNGNSVDASDIRYVNINVTIPESGMLKIENLPIGEYTITETKTPDEYNLGLQITTQTIVIEQDPEAVTADNQVIKVLDGAGASTGTGAGIVQFDYQNRKYGNLEVMKVDADTGEISLEDLLLQNIAFVIAYDDGSGKQYMASLQEFDSGDIKYEIVPTSSASEAQIFMTDGYAKFTMSNLPEYYTYYIEEVELPDEIAQYYNIREPFQAKLQNNYDGTVTYFVIDNKQVRVDLEGYVWEDIAEGKTTTRDELYNENTADKRVAGLTVYLKKDGSIIAERKTDDNGRYFFEARGYKTTAGLAGVDDCDYTIDIETLSQYVVEFEYNGLKYEKVLTNLGADNGSKATEINSNRTTFNDKFHNIQKDKTGTGVGLTYTRPESGVSELVQNTAYTVESLSGSVNPNAEALMLADTETAGYVIKWSAGVRRVRNINLGIFERAQPDLSIATDIDDIQLTIDNSSGLYSHTYEYKSRSPYMNNTGIPDKDINPGYDAVLDGFSVGVKRGNGTYRDCSYTREIYDSYIAYTKANKESNDRLRVFVKYKIAIKNESGSFISRAALKNYADTRLDYSSSYYVDGNGNQAAVNWSSAGNGIWQSEEVRTDIKPSECIYVYLIYELNTDTIIAMANLKNDESLKMDNNITEICSYSTWDKNGNTYGGIDKDSAPDNIQIGNFDTYEDDTDVAPGLEFKRKTSKVISGLVYEDQTANRNNPQGIERIGNGKYDDGEKAISNTKVQIIDCNTNQAIKLYSINNDGSIKIDDAEGMTDTEGRYSFTGLVPGKYRIQYTYGWYDDNQTKINNTIEVTTEGYKSTIVNADKFRTLIDNGYIDYSSSDPNALWYWYQKPENFDYSSAVDDYNRRLTINENLSVINYKTKTDYEAKIDNAENHYMIASTGVMDLPIEDTRVQTTDINYIQGSREYKLKFGIAERPRQGVHVIKEISYIRITLANGQILAEGDPRNSDVMNYVQYPPSGILKVEVDNEIIDGATIDIMYEISVTNESEVDYRHIRYYRYGDVDAEVRNTLTSIRLDAIVDYVDEKLSVTYDIDSGGEIEYYNPDTDNVNNKWKLITDITKEENKLAGIDVKDEIYNTVKNTKRTNIVVAKTDRWVNPNEIERITLRTKKLLTNLTGEDVYDNSTELIQVFNPDGRFYGDVHSVRKILYTR